MGIFNPLKEEVKRIQFGFKKAVDEELNSQNMKAELITNVSHDLKTPLTAIITYINLLKEETLTPEDRASYINVLDLKSMRLKQLIEDLFEISKATSNTTNRSLVDVDILPLEEVHIILKNMSATELNFDSVEITERFARGDKSRYSEGSGLGLAIVKSFVELQQGSFQVEIDGDLFKAIIKYPYAKKDRI